MSYSPGSGGGGGTLSTASDVALSLPAQAQYIGYNSNLQKWQNFSRPPQLIENVFTNNNAGPTETIADVTAYTISNLTLTATCTISFPPAAAGKSFMVLLSQDSTGNRTVVWPGSVNWPGGTAPTLSTASGATDVFSFICVDGASWLGFTAGKGY